MKFQFRTVCVVDLSFDYVKMTSNFASDGSVRCAYAMHAGRVLYRYEFLENFKKLTSL